MPGLSYQAILLAGGDDKRLYPLSSVKALLPVANKPLISYPLKALSDAACKHCFIVVSGEKPAASIQAWLNTEYKDKGMQCEVGGDVHGLGSSCCMLGGTSGGRAMPGVLPASFPCATSGQHQHCLHPSQVITVAEDHGTADALRAISAKLTAQTVVVVSGDLLTDLPISTLVANHQMNATLATVLLFRRKVSPTTETKPGKAPKVGAGCGRWPGGASRGRF